MNTCLSSVLSPHSDFFPTFQICPKQPPLANNMTFSLSLHPLPLHHLYLSKFSTVPAHLIAAFSQNHTPYSGCLLVLQLSTNPPAVHNSSSCSQVLQLFASPPTINFLYSSHPRSWKESKPSILNQIRNNPFFPYRYIWNKLVSLTLLSIYRATKNITLLFNNIPRPF